MEGGRAQTSAPTLGDVLCVPHTHPWDQTAPHPLPSIFHLDPGCAAAPGEDWGNLALMSTSSSIHKPLHSFIYSSMHLSFSPNLLQVQFARKKQVKDLGFALEGR